jgi:hypothetical protein
VDLDSRPRRVDSVLRQDAGGITLLLAPDSGEYFTLNDVGASVWELADGTRTVEALVEELAREYAAPIEQIEADALALLAELARENLVQDDAGRARQGS